jgi:hypothetical protein
MEKEYKPRTIEEKRIGKIEAGKPLYLKRM